MTSINVEPKKRFCTKKVKIQEIDASFYPLQQQQQQQRQQQRQQLQN